MRLAIPWLACLVILAGCGRVPDPLPARQADPHPPSLVSPAGNAPRTVLPPAADRYLAFTACRVGDRAGGLYLWDAAVQDVYVLDGAIAGLWPLTKTVRGPEDCEAIAQLNPRAFGTGRILFSFGSKVFVYDLLAEVRITLATDGRSYAQGGPRAVVSRDGSVLVYVSSAGTLVLKAGDPIYSTKGRELAKIAAELAAMARRKGYGGILEDFDLSADGKTLVLNIDGAVYLYVIGTPRLYEAAPLDGTALAGMGDGFGHVAISPDGKLVAATIVGQRLLVFDCERHVVDTVPYANLGDGDPVIVWDPLFGLDGRSLYFETRVGDTLKLRCYDLETETLRTLAILNDVLGEDTDDILVSAVS